MCITHSTECLYTGSIFQQQFHTLQLIFDGRKNQNSRILYTTVLSMNRKLNTNKYYTKLKLVSRYLNDFHTLNSAVLVLTSAPNCRHNAAKSTRPFTTATANTDMSSYYQYNQYNDNNNL